MKNIFEANAAKLETLQLRVRESARKRNESPERLAAWEEATKEFFAAYDRLAFPGGLNQQFESLKAGDSEAVEMAVRYLEADPWYFRSGYYKADMLRLLKRHPLNDDQCARLRQVILNKVRGRYTRETRKYCSFAPKVTTPEFEAEMRNIAENSNRFASRNAQSGSIV